MVRYMCLAYLQYNNGTRAVNHLAFESCIEIWAIWIDTCAHVLTNSNPSGPAQAHHLTRARFYPPQEEY